MAENGAAAITVLEGGFDPDLILTDLMMPVMSGWDFCKTLKGRAAWRSIPVVVLCGMTPDQRGKLQVEGAFEKPTHLPTLFGRIAELCGV
ncbi:MAG: response regulator [Archangiaceae bacterium]|nr:response regulator [Archangiaceae bacterium]